MWRWPAFLVPLLATGCGTDPIAEGGVSLVLDIPNGMLDPTGFTSVEVTLHAPNGDTVRSATIGPQKTFDLGDIEPQQDVWIEAVLRNASGAAVGYGRTAGSASFTPALEIVVPVRRPIIYFAGLVSIDQDGDPTTTNDIRWSTVPATFSDLSIGTALDGTPTVGSKAVLAIAAGPTMYLVDQATSDPMGTLVGQASILPVSSGDHAMTAALTGKATGGVQDGAGSDDGTTIVIATTTKLAAIDTTTGVLREIADGNFSRVAIVNGGAGIVGAIAIKNRPSTTGASCATNAELVWAPLPVAETPMVRTIAMGSFTDVATSGGKAYVVDCAGTLSEVRDGMTVMTLRMQLGRTTALAVGNQQAYVGVEKPGTPASLALLATPLVGMTPPHTLWSEVLQQVVNAPMYPGVQRQLAANRAEFRHLEIGAGGDYVAATMAARFSGNRIAAANFPQMDIDTEELRVFDPASSSIVQRYRSWCDGSILPGGFNDILSWACATESGQTAPANASLEHRISSMAFAFGKK